ncbi:MAG: calcium-binding protein, partial [Tepidisphaerales bacterium]
MSTDFCVIRLNPDGTLDNTFGTDGVATATMGSSGAKVAEMTLDSSGRITLVGAADGDVAIARFTASGALDTSFSGDGK